MKPWGMGDFMNNRMLVVLVSLVPVNAAAQTDGIFKEHTALVVPRANIPIGAEWIPGVGPNGEGTPSNVGISAGMSGSTIDTTTRRKIAFGLGSLLGLDANATNERNVKLEGIEIHRVKDLGQLPLAAGQQVLFEGIKAKTISIVVDKVNGAKLKAAAEAKGIPVSADVDAGGTRKITLDGSDLFLAYQVISFSKPTARTTVKYHGGKDITIDETYRFRFCECLENGGVEVFMTNLLAPSTGAVFNTQRKELPGNIAWAEFGLPPHRQGNNITANLATIRFHNDRVYYTTPEGEKKFMSSYPKERNSIELRSTKFRIEPVRNPSASY